MSKKFHNTKSEWKYVEKSEFGNSRTNLSSTITEDVVQRKENQTNLNIGKQVK